MKFVSLVFILLSIPLSNSYVLGVLARLMRRWTPILWVLQLASDILHESGGWGRAVLRTVAPKRSLQFFISPTPRFAFLPHMPLLSLKIVGTCSC